MSKPPPAKARRIVLQPTSAPPLPRGDLDVSPMLALSDSVSTRLGCKPSPASSVHNAEMLGELLEREAQRALATHDCWARSPHAAWIKELRSELPASVRPALLKQQRKLWTVAAEDFSTRWELLSSFASLILDLWLSQEGRTLESVLQKSAALGHDALATGGIVLNGRLVSGMAVGSNISLDQLAPWVETLASHTATDGRHGNNDVSAFRVRRENHFLSDAPPPPPPAAAVAGAPGAHGRGRGRAAALLAEVRERLSSGVGGLGSLSTTFEYGGMAEDEAAAASASGAASADVASASVSAAQGMSGVPILDSYMSSLDEVAYVLGESTVRLNPRLYLIWKLQGYCTPYHQDVHVPPHFTLYNQASGQSTFHFLPLLVGLYATHVGRTQGAQALAGLIAELDRRGIGERATLGPAQMLLILPFGAHGVYVPVQPQPPAAAATAAAHANAHESSASASASASGSASPPEPFELSVIRAAELFARKVCDVYEARLMRGVGLGRFTGGGGEGGGGSGLPPEEEAAAKDSAGKEEVTPSNEMWREVLPLTIEERADEAARVREFTRRQEVLCEEMGLSKGDWLWAATRMQRAWDAERERQARSTRRRGDGTAADEDDGDDGDDGDDDSDEQ